MHCIPYSVVAKASSDGIRTNLLSYSRIERTTNLSKWLHRIVMSDFQGHHWSRQHVLYYFHVFWKEFIHFEELLGGLFVQPEHLHCTYFKSCSQNVIHNFSDVFFLYRMWFDHT